MGQSKWEMPNDTKAAETQLDFPTICTERFHQIDAEIEKGKR